MVAFHPWIAQTVSLATGAAFVGLSGKLTEMGGATDSEMTFMAGLAATSAYAVTPALAAVPRQLFTIPSRFENYTKSKQWRDFLRNPEIVASINPLSAASSRYQFPHNVYVNAYRVLYYGTFSFFQVPAISDLVIYGDLGGVGKVMLANVLAPFFIGAMLLPRRDEW